MATGVTGSVRAFEFTPVRHTSRRTFAIQVMFAQGRLLICDTLSLFEIMLF